LCDAAVPSCKAAEGGRCAPFAAKKSRAGGVRVPIKVPKTFSPASPAPKAGSFHRSLWLRWGIRLAALALVLPSSLSAAPADLSYRRLDSFPATLLALRAVVESIPDIPPERVARWHEGLSEDFPVETDWLMQDGGSEMAGWFGAKAGSDIEQRMIERALAALDESSAPLRREQEQLRQKKAASGNARWLDLYVRAGEQRRVRRLETMRALAPRFIFTKHRTIRPSFFAYTEGQSDAQAERHFIAGAELCLWELDGATNKVRTLLADPTGAIRDPAVSWDGTRVLFAWKKSLDGDDYHHYELEVASGKIRQITSGLGFADYEPAYLPNGAIIFSSTRCVQIVDCWWTEVSNLYTCDKDGRYLRRLQRPWPGLSAGAVPDEFGRHRTDRVLRQQLMVPHHHRARAGHSWNSKGARHPLRSSFDAGRQAGRHRSSQGPPGEHRRPTRRARSRNEGGTH
jgi:hypothetical protein